jgi:hypothetical protein
MKNESQIFPRWSNTLACASCNGLRSTLFKEGFVNLADAVAIPQRAPDQRLPGGWNTWQHFAFTRC